MERYLLVESLDGKWTFACEYTEGWSAPAFNTKEDVLSYVKETFPNLKECMIGTIESFYEAKYVENREWIEL